MTHYLIFFLIFILTLIIWRKTADPGYKEKYIFGVIASFGGIIFINFFLYVFDSVLKNDFKNSNLILVKDLGAIVGQLFPLIMHLGEMIFGLSIILLIGNFIISNIKPRETFIDRLFKRFFKLPKLYRSITYFILFVLYTQVYKVFPESIMDVEPGNVILSSIVAPLGFLFYILPFILEKFLWYIIGGIIFLKVMKYWKGNQILNASSDSSQDEDHFFDIFYRRFLKYERDLKKMKNSTYSSRHELLNEFYEWVQSQDTRDVEFIVTQFYLYNNKPVPDIISFNHFKEMFIPEQIDDVYGFYCTSGKGRGNEKK
jgi:hypothetical protein